MDRQICAEGQFGITRLAMLGYNHGAHHFELERFDVIVTCALTDEIM